MFISVFFLCLKCKAQRGCTWRKCYFKAEIFWGKEGVMGCEGACLDYIFTGIFQPKIHIHIKSAGISCKIYNMSLDMDNG